MSAGEFLPPTQEQTIAYLEDEVQRTRADIREREDAAISQAFADCEALVSAGLLALAEKGEAKAKEAYSAWLAAAQREGSYSSEEVSRWREAYFRQDARATSLREMSMAVSLGQFRTAECNERAVIAAHREAAGFNSSKAGGEARMKALTPAKRKKIATKAARARWAAKKGE